MKHLLTALLLTLITGCALFSGSQERAEAQATTTLTRYIESLQAKDLNTISALLTPDAPERADLVEGLTILFSRYDLIYRIKSIHTVAYERNRILLQADTAIHRRAGAPFEPQNRTDRYELHYQNGAWKIFATQSLLTTIGN